MSLSLCIALLGGIGQFQCILIKGLSWSVIQLQNRLKGIYDILSISIFVLQLLSFSPPFIWHCQKTKKMCGYQAMGDGGAFCVSLCQWFTKSWLLNLWEELSFSLKLGDQKSFWLIQVLANVSCSLMKSFMRWCWFERVAVFDILGLDV